MGGVRDGSDAGQTLANHLLRWKHLKKEELLVVPESEKQDARRKDRKRQERGCVEEFGGGRAKRKVVPYESRGNLADLHDEVEESRRDD